jgi:hypothetical protein
MLSSDEGWMAIAEGERSQENMDSEEETWRRLDGSHSFLLLSNDITNHLKRTPNSNGRICIQLI